MLHPVSPHLNVATRHSLAAQSEAHYGTTLWYHRSPQAYTKALDVVKLFAKKTCKRLTSQSTPGVGMLEALPFYSSTLFLMKDGHVFETAAAQLMHYCVQVTSKDRNVQELVQDRRHSQQPTQKAP